MGWGFRDGPGKQFGGGGGWFRLGLGGLEFDEGFEGFAVGADGGFEAAAEVVEFLGIGGVGAAERRLPGGLPGIFDLEGPEFGLGVAEAANGPVDEDEGVDEEALFGGGGVPALEVLVGEGLEVAGIFAGDDFAFGVDAGFEGIEGGFGLAGFGAGAGGFECVAPIGVELCLGTHA